MYFAPSTIAAVAGLIASAQAAPLAHPNATLPDSVTAHGHGHGLDKRGLFDWWFQPQQQTVSLCYKNNYGAVGKPWESNSTPGSFCGSKPRNDGMWRNIPSWDGGDNVKCQSWWYGWGLNVCSGGNKRSQLPWGCSPPKASQPKPTPKPSAKPSASASSSKAAASSAAASSASASSAAGTTSSAAGTTSSAAATTSSASATSSASDPSNSGTTPDPNPYSDPVCSGNYQQTYSNYTLVAPNGYWTGKTVGAATQDASYMTYTLATDPSQCLTACNNIEGCVFVNSYIDRNDDETQYPKHAPGVYTCAMFSKCVGTEMNNNWGGQDDPNDILNSAGWCKSGACGGRS